MHYYSHRALDSTRIIIHTNSPFSPLSHQGDQRFRLECACVTIHNGQDSYLIMVHCTKSVVSTKKPGDNGYWCWAVICHLSRLLRMRWTRFFSFIVLSSSANAGLKLRSCKRMNHLQASTTSLTKGQHSTWSFYLGRKPSFQMKTLWV